MRDDNAYMSTYERKERAREKKRALEARSKLRKQRGRTPSPERDRHWNGNTKTTALFDPSVKKVDIFRLRKRKSNEKKGGKNRAEERKKVSAQEAIASAIESILHPTDKEREEEEIERIMQKKQPPPPLSPMGKQLSVAVPSPRLTDVVKVLEASTSPIDENVLHQITGTMMRSDPRIDTRSSREYLDEKGVRLHNRDTDFRNATRRVMIKSPDAQQYASTVGESSPVPMAADASSPRSVGSRSPRGGLRARRDDEGSLIDHPTFASPYVKSQESRRKMATLKARVDGASAGVGDAVNSNAAGGLDWGKSGIDVSMSHVDMETTLNNIRMLRQVSGNGMSLGHLQDNLVSKLQAIYRTHDDAVHLLEEMDTKRASSSVLRVGGAPDGLLRPSAAVVPPVSSPKRAPGLAENVRLLTAPVSESSSKGDKWEAKEWYDATHLPSGHVKTAGEAFVQDRNTWQKKPVHLVDEGSSVLTFSKTASGQAYGNFGAYREPQDVLTKGDEDAMESLFKYTSSYVPPTNVPSIGATHETAGWAIQREGTTNGAPGGAAEHLRRMQEKSMSLEESGVQASESGTHAALAAHLQAENDDYITEAFRQKRLSAVKDFPRLDSYMPHDTIQTVNTYMNDLHFMQGVRGAAFGARGVSMKFCIDRATDMIMKELVDKVADEIDKMLAQQTDLLVGKI
jgi:hypothetical protein